jgi:hypothetical protein
MPRPAAFLIAIPLAVFAISFGLRATLADSNDEETPVQESVPSPPPVLNVVVAEPQLLPTPVPEPDPAIADRTDCAEIEGTDYRSPAEREWYIANCSGGGETQAATGAVDGAQTVTGPPPAVGGGQSPLGDRLVIPAIGVNADVWGTAVGGTGAMPDPVGYFNALWYDFSGFPGLGGNVTGGNLVMSGHVDCARCHNGSPGLAVFYYIRNLGPGDSIQYYTAGGQVVNYVVMSSGDYDSSANWAAIVAAGAADLTLITCTGTWNAAAHEYSHRHVVFARKV